MCSGIEMAAYLKNMFGVSVCVCMYVLMHVNACIFVCVGKRERERRGKHRIYKSNSAC